MAHKSSKIKRLSIYNRHHLYAYVDDEDFERCKALRWYACRLYNVDQYGRRIGLGFWHIYTLFKVDGKYIRESLARFVLRAPPGRRVRYVHSNYSDNRKANLTMSGERQGQLPPEKVLQNAVTNVLRADRTKVSYMRMVERARREDKERLERWLVQALPKSRDLQNRI